MKIRVSGIHLPHAIPRGKKKEKVSLCEPIQLEGTYIFILMAELFSLLALKCPGKCQKTVLPDDISNDPSKV